MSTVAYPIGEVKEGHCLWCGEHVGENRSTRIKKWCSVECGQRAAYFRKKSGVRGPRNKYCDDCGTELDYSPGTTVKRFCDQNCQRRYRFKNVPGVKDRHDESSRTWKRKNAHKNYIQGPRALCLSCGDVLKMTYGRFCSKCRSESRAYKHPGSVICKEDGCDRRAESKEFCQAHYTADYMRRNPDKYRARNARRYALSRGASSAEVVHRAVVMECSKWTCHICGGPIDPHCEYPSPLYGSVDHIVPLSRGGAHIYENVKAAHLSCNSKKGAREDYVHEN